MLALSRLDTTRIVANPAALDNANYAEDAVVIRIAQDEALIIPAQADIALSDEHAIVIADTAWSGIWVSHEEVADILEQHCDWEAPTERPAQAQGAVAGIPTKFYFTEDAVLIVIPAPYQREFEDRI